MQQENDEVEYELSETKIDEYEQDNYEDNNGRDQYLNSDKLPDQVRTTILNDQDMSDRMKSFNFKQRQVFDFVSKRAKHLIKFKSIKLTNQQ